MEAIPGGPGEWKLSLGDRERRADAYEPHVPEQGCITQARQDAFQAGISQARLTQAARLNMQKYAYYHIFEA